MPPLRERPEDILLIAKHYLNKFSRDNDKAINGITDKAMQALQSYSWPGNIRELINVIERGTILSQHNMMTREELPPHILNYKHGKSSAGEMQTLAKAEKTHIKEALLHTASIEEAARVLGIDPATLWRKRKKYQLD